MSDLDEDYFEYGKLYEHSLGEARQPVPARAEDIWPNWTDGLPTKLRRTYWLDTHSVGRVRYDARSVQETIDFEWSKAHALHKLDSRYGPLPGKYSSQWKGVYRIFLPNKSIGRLCADDPTGTLYIGKAGSSRGWSILRSRVQAAISRRHHATSWWSYQGVLRDKHPWETLAIQWAYVADRIDHRGEMAKVAGNAESMLLRCYHDTFGELPPLNEKG